jgi:hypothetical protein
MRTRRRFRDDERGSTLIETTLIFPMMLILTFGLVEFGHALWEYNAAEKATSAGARFLATRGPVMTGVPDCFVDAGATTAGTSCALVPGATAWSETCPGAQGCNAAVMTQLVTEMQAYAPFIDGDNVRVDVHGSGMGFVGRGRPVPLLTIRTTELTYDFVAIDDLLGIGPITMPGFDTTLVGEDQREGP